MTRMCRTIHAPRQGRVARAGTGSTALGAGTVTGRWQGAGAREGVAPRPPTPPARRSVQRPTRRSAHTARTPVRAAAQPSGGPSPGPLGRTERWASHDPSPNSSAGADQTSRHPTVGPPSGPTVQATEARRASRARVGSNGGGAPAAPGPGLGSISAPGACARRGYGVLDQARQPRPGRISSRWPPLRSRGTCRPCRGAPACRPARTTSLRRQARRGTGPPAS